MVNYSVMTEIGASQQFIQVRGKHEKKPLLLLLHGGPGAPLSIIHEKLPNELEDLFLVAHWDQRGTGRSYHEDIPLDTMNLERFIADLNEVVDYLLKTYKKEKLFLFGLSWGSVIGLSAVHRFPEKFYAYIGTGQVIDVIEGENISYDYLLKHVTKIKNKEALNELMKIGHPPYKNIEELMTQRKWLRKLGLSERKVNTSQLVSECCTDEEIRVIIKGVQFSEVLTTNLENFNFYDLKDFKVPIYFCMGKYDYQTPSILVKKYYKTIKAPKKSFIWFKDSAHSTLFEEPHKMIKILNKIKNMHLR